MPERATVTRILKPEDWISRQISTLKAVGETNYGTGIASPRKDPIAAGIAAEDRYASQTRKAIEEGRRAKALQATNIDEWFTYSTNIGKGRLVEGVTKREKEVRDFVNPWHSMLSDHVSKIDVLPAVTDADMENRVLTNLRGLKGMKSAWRGR